jgi:2-dehydro-3-deoxygalactonokinase
MQKFISCDWGTSALRLRIVDLTTMSVEAEALNYQGISAIYNLWKQSGKQASERLSFYQSVLTGQIGKMEEQLNYSLQDMPLIISGMASSDMGMMELSYKEIPVSMNGHDLHVKIIEAAEDFRHRALVISGVKKENDVMRGEETQLIGCLNDGNNEDQLFVFPGTHSKHIMIKNEKAVDFNSFMTGELFEVLSKKSTLSNSVEENTDILSADNLRSFEKGVADSENLNLLHSLFLVRTNALLTKLSKRQNYFYFSGLLIGTELKELIDIKMPVTVVSDEFIIKLYSTALRKLGIYKIKHQDGGKAVIAGHCKIYNLYNNELITGQTFIKQ